MFFIVSSSLGAVSDWERSVLRLLFLVDLQRSVYASSLSSPFPSSIPPFTIEFFTANENRATTQARLVEVNTTLYQKIATKKGLEDFMNALESSGMQ